MEDLLPSDPQNMTVWTQITVLHVPDDQVLGCSSAWEGTLSHTQQGLPVPRVE